MVERDAPVIAALNAVVERHPRHGFWKCVDRIRRDVFPWNHKRIHRVYKALRLNIPRRARRRLPARLRQPLEAPAVLNRTWALDFMTDSLYGGRQFRALTVIGRGQPRGPGDRDRHFDPQRTRDSRARGARGAPRQTDRVPRR
jgi:putative transposase